MTHPVEPTLGGFRPAIYLLGEVLSYRFYTALRARIGYLGRQWILVGAAARSLLGSRPAVG